MPIGSNDIVMLSRRDAAGIGTLAATQLAGTTANTANVTQLTSRTTGVTLNSPVGTITLFNVANSQTDASFTLTNSSIEVGDVVLVTQRNGTDPQRIAVTATAAGSCRITCAAISGTTAEAPVFNFAVVKATII
jgi:hypothetical protein